VFSQTVGSIINGSFERHCSGNGHSGNSDPAAERHRHSINTANSRVCSVTNAVNGRYDLLGAVNDLAHSLSAERKFKSRKNPQQSFFVVDNKFDCTYNIFRELFKSSALYPVLSLFEPLIKQRLYFLHGVNESLFYFVNVVIEDGKPALCKIIKRLRYLNKSVFPGSFELV